MDQLLRNNGGVDQFLKHYGVMGMKWGVRKSTLTKTTKDGSSITLSHMPPPKITQFASKYIPALKRNVDNTANYTLKDKTGNAIGDMTLYRESKDSLNVVWISTKSSVRGRGYATAAMQSVVDIAKETGCKKVTLEVPGNSPDARHVYSKLGFKEVSSPDRDVDDVWGGLTNMMLDVSDTVTHREPLEFNPEKLLELICKYADNIQSDSDEIKHYGVMGMKWGHHKSIDINSTLQNISRKVEKSAYAVGAKINPREFKYTVRKSTNKVSDDIRMLSDITKSYTKENGKLPTNPKNLKAVESVGIDSHKKQIYDNLTDADIKKLKTYTDSARYSRSVNGYLAIGEPKSHAKEAEELKNTLRKNNIDNQVVYRSCNFKFSVNGVAKKLDQMSEPELAESFSKMSKNFKGKSTKENRIFSTSTSPLFAIDTWRAVNPTAASTYNTYMIINCKKCPGVLADGRTNKGQSLVNTRSNQEAILAPNKLVYKKLEYDEERGMFAITVDAE